MRRRSWDVEALILIEIKIYRSCSPGGLLSVLCLREHWPRFARRGKVMILDQCSGTLGKICREVFYCWLWDYVRTILKISVKPRRRTSGAQIYCVFQTRGRNGGDWNQEDDLQKTFSQILILYILLQSTLNSESRPRRLLQKIYNSMKPMSGRLCGGAYGWTLPDASQTYFILWDIIDLPSPQIGAKTLFLVFFYCR